MITMSYGVLKGELQQRTRYYTNLNWNKLCADIQVAFDVGNIRKMSEAIGNRSMLIQNRSFEK